MDFLWSAKEVTIAFSVIAFTIMGVIVCSRFLLDRSKKYFIKKSQCQNTGLSERTKYKIVNPLRYRSTSLLFGAAFSLVFVLSAFNYTTFDTTVYIDHQGDFNIDDFFILPPRTKHEIPPPPPPPPPPPAVIEVVVDEKIIEPDFIDNSVEATEEVLPSEELVKEPIPLPKPVLPEYYEEVDEIVSFSEEPPIFPDCSGLTGSIDMKRACTQEKLLSFIYKNLKYPNIAKENGVEGQVVVQFVINKNGTLSNIKLLRDIGGGCGAEAISTIEKMNESHGNWAPGRQNGRAVSVYFTLPIRFRLEG